MQPNVLARYPLLAGLLVPGICAASAVDVPAYVEFLWAPAGEGAVARQETLGFVLDGEASHQVCVAVLGTSPPGIKGVRIEAVDAAGKLASSQTHDDFRGTKRCYPAALDKRGEPGKWTFNVYLQGEQVASRTIEVASKLKTALFYAPSAIPYVLGRPNYDATIAPGDFTGRLVWIMHIDATGTVTKVDIEAAEGVGVLMKERAIAAGYMSLFPPDPSRSGEAATYRRELVFKPD